MDIDTGEMFKFSPKTPKGGHKDFKDEFIKFSASVGIWIGHNIIGYDMPNINRLLNGEFIKRSDVRDTLVLSRLFRPVSPFKRINTDDRFGGHSLEAWGQRLGYPKIHFNDWSQYTEEMGTYCDRDVELGVKVYNVLMAEKIGFSQECIDLEHEVAYCLWLQEQNGFYLIQDNAKKLVEDTSRQLSIMDIQLQKLFPPIWKLNKNYNPPLNKDGTLGLVPQRILNAHSNNPSLKAEVQPDGSYNLYQLEVFNPESGKQIAERLVSIGWKPKKFTEKGNIATDQVTLQEALEDIIREQPDKLEVRCLSEYSIVSNRHQKALKWLELAAKDGRVHGRINPIGAGTHRCSHFDDNMANIASVVTTKAPITTFPTVNFNGIHKFDVLPNDGIYIKHDKEKVEYALRGIEGGYGWDSRNCWGVPSNDLRLVGADAAGIQLRALAHYMNDKTYTEALLHGDIHEVNRVAAGIRDRPTSKTFIYAWLLGAGDEKIGTIVGVSESEWDDLFAYASNRKKWGQDLLSYFIGNLRDKGRKADRKTVATVIKGYKTKENFLNRTPALKTLRKETIPAITKQGYLVGLDGRKLWIPNEHLAMSLYLQGFEAVVMKKAIVLFHEDLWSQGIPFKMVAYVHDEIQIETPVQYADAVGIAIVKAIRQAGILYKTNCPLDGEYKVGMTWAQTH